MKKLMIVAAILLAGCGPEEAEEKKQVNKNFVVERLFTHEGCTVYRFYDNDLSRYFSDCRGKVSSEWTESCGKNCSRLVESEVETVR